MFPVLFEIGGVGIDTHGAFIGLGLVAASVLLLTESRRKGRLDRRLLLVGLGALTAAAVTSRLGAGIRYLANAPEPTAQGLLLEAGRSLLGGLVGAYVGVEVTKRFVGITRSTGDLFAPGVALGLAIGRVGCFLTEQLGTPSDLPWAMTMNRTGVDRGLLCLDCGQCPTCNPATTFHPSFLYEIIFHAVAFVVLWRKRDDPAWRDKMLARYLMAYAAFRFLVEFVRGNVEFLFGLTGSQIFIIGTALASSAIVLVASTRDRNQPQTEPRTEDQPRTEEQPEQQSEQQTRSNPAVSELQR